MNHHTLLGISPGTRFMGIAIVKDGQLVDWRTKNFKGSWNDDKLQTIIRVVDEIINRYQVTHIALKIPIHNMEHIGTETLIKELIKYAKSRQIRLYRYSLPTLKHIYCSNKKVPMRELMSVLASKYPELFFEYQKEQRNYNPYYVPMFEAVAVSIHASEGLCLLR